MTHCVHVRVNAVRRDLSYAQELCPSVLSHAREDGEQSCSLQFSAAPTLALALVGNMRSQELACYQKCYPQVSEIACCLQVEVIALFATRIKHKPVL